MNLPPEQFLQSGSGRVLYAGAGSGRSTIMALLARPQARVVALDIFSNSYGIDENTPERLRHNAVKANASDRLEILTGDMRDMPFGDNSFEGAVSAFAIDHLSRDGVAQTLAEIRRVLKPRGDFLLAVIRPDMYIRVVYSLVAEHGYFGPRDIEACWTNELRTAGFEMIELGTQPGMLYILGRSPD